jgi:hypothetical protein
MSAALQSQLDMPNPFVDRGFTTTTALTASQTVPANTASTYALPAGSASYPHLIVENLTGASIYVSLGTASPVPVGGPDVVSGCTIIAPGYCHVFLGALNDSYIGVLAPAGGGTVNWAFVSG